ncbi:hypothetical protein CkaCkLH20_03919 [Colletotrichum karsti]|uniref:N-acetyltransferase domain-containing protein n=1 Tax=Colletotrichum karsti TaxID=1095194 RepID=A0A9P6I7P5_9PEZI|nr:uncharacterized protein CkaCkLH20_03919 [Colletotrichum karsti]KAF9878427.1 hypothetical protein CkaCkLH20_03919 [Colletotrichum karsti]
MSRSKVQLVPFDPESPDHADRMLQQRIECGWHFDKVHAWKEDQRSGLKCIYWISIHPSDPDAESKLSKHTTLFPKVRHPHPPILTGTQMISQEKEPLKDTASSIRSTPRTPTETAFIPVGHISLDVDNPAATRLALPIPAENLYWIKSLYVSYALQSSGIGRAAMDEVEAMATREPLRARVLMLDTVCKEDQHREEMVAQVQGRPPAMSTEEWYARRGYEVIWKELNFYPDFDKDGKPLGRSTVFMRRDLVQFPER